MNFFSHSVGAGFLLSGLFHRANDALSFGFGPAWTTPEVREAIPTLPRAEYPYELTYAAVINKWVTLQPDLQYIAFQGGDHEIYKNEVLLGLRLILTLI